VRCVRYLGVQNPPTGFSASATGPSVMVSALTVLVVVAVEQEPRAAAQV